MVAVSGAAARGEAGGGVTPSDTTTRLTEIETPLGRARWILTTDERGTQAEVDAFDALLALVTQLHDALSEAEARADREHERAETRAAETLKFMEAAAVEFVRANNAEAALAVVSSGGPEHPETGTPAAQSEHDSLKGEAHGA